MTNAGVGPRDHRTGREGDAGRHETEAERIDRNLGELLQELRVASIGVQVLFGFLLALPFTNRFRVLDDRQRALYLVDLVLAAVAIALLIAPVAHHRLVFRQHKKEELLRRSHHFAMAGLLALGFTVVGSVLLVTSVVSTGAVVPFVTLVTAVALFGLWLVPPLTDRHRDDY